MTLSTTEEIAAQPSATGVKNVVLIHGAFADGSSWSKIIPLLEAKGLHAIAVQNPLGSLEDDVAAAKRAIALLDGPVLLVGHSWGGVVISQAGNDPKVAGLVYVAAFAPDDNQSLVDASKAFPPTPGLNEAKPEIRFVAKHGQGRVAKAVLISAVTPLMVQTETNPDGIPMSVFDGIREGTATQRPQYFQDFTLPFYGYNREGARVSQGIRDNWWRQGMMGGIKAHHDGIKAFSETDFTEDLKGVDVPVLVLHGEDDQIVPFPISGAKAVKLLKQGKLISYPGFPHGMSTTEAATINADLLAFINSCLTDSLQSIDPQKSCPYFY